MNIFTKQKLSHRCRKQTCGYQGEEERGMNGETGTDIYTLLYIEWASQVHSGKHTHLPMQEKQEKWIQPLGQENPLQYEMEIRSSYLAWKVLWTEEPGWLQSMGSQRFRHD